QTKRGNSASVRSLSFDSRDNLLFGAGFERDIYVWDMWSQLGMPLFRLQAHKDRVLQVAMAPHSGRAVSLDAAGRLALWDTRRNAAIDAADRCLCVVEADGGDVPRHCDIVYGDDEAARQWSHCGVSVVAAGRRMHALDCVDPRRAEDPLTAALYNSTSVSFITCNDRAVTLWDACSGELVRAIAAAVPAEITCAAWDTCERKLVLGTGGGHIVVFAYLQGLAMRTLPPHGAAVSGLAYCGADRVIVTASWDRCLRAYDEVAEDSNASLLREVNGAHDADITALALSRPLGLVATGAADGTLRLWDFQYWFRDADAAQLGGAELLQLLFLDPYPLLLTGDAGGCVSLLPVRP
ncbi:unnamed protein product, partial [Phaeothamnion confervicola]